MNSDNKTPVKAEGGLDVTKEDTPESNVVEPASLIKKYTEPPKIEVKGNRT
jgi:hypothetical protein